MRGSSTGQIPKGTGTMMFSSPARTTPRPSLCTATRTNMPSVPPRTVGLFPLDRPQDVAPLR